MGINFTPKTETVKIPGGESFVVRGLSLEDFAVLLRSHHAPLSALFDQYVSEAALESVDEAMGANLNIGDVKGVILEALEHAPALVGDAIARGADETENPHLARTLPIGVQADAVSKIVTLTLEAEGGMEKLLETVINLVTTMSTAVANRSP